jgi:hypothetical protein
VPLLFDEAQPDASVAEKKVHESPRIDNFQKVLDGRHHPAVVFGSGMVDSMRGSRLKALITEKEVRRVPLEEARTVLAARKALNQLLLTPGRLDHLS